MAAERNDAHTNRWRLGRWASGVVGLVLLAAGVVKATNLELFMAQIKAYGVIDGPVLLLISAWGLVAVQVCLGAALALAYRPWWSLGAASLLWLVLLGGTSWAAWTGATDKCGCFGAFLEHSPAAATLQNALFLGATLYAFQAMKRAPVPAHGPARAWVVAFACLAGVLLPAVFGVPLNAGMNVTEGSAHRLEELAGTEIQGASWPENGGGPLLLVLMGTDCGHCLEALPDLDALAEESEVPPVLALCADDRPKREGFTRRFQPSFPLGGVSKETFWRLLSTGDMPRVLLVRRGKVVHAWDGTVPEAADVLKRLADVPA